MAAFPVGSGSIPCTQPSHNHLNSSPRVLAPSSGLYVQHAYSPEKVSFALYPSAGTGWGGKNGVGERGGAQDTMGRLKVCAAATGTDYLH